MTAKALDFALAVVAHELGAVERRQAIRQRAYSLSLAMGLTVILTTISLIHRNAPSSRTLISKESRTSEDVRGHAADVCGVKRLPWSIDFGSPKIGSDVRFRNGADSHEAAAEESTYA